MNYLPSATLNPPDSVKIRAAKTGCRTATAVASPLVVCAVICAGFLAWFSTSTARILESGELRSQVENVTLLANYFQHFIEDLQQDADLVAARLAAGAPPADAADLRRDFRSPQHIRAFTVFDHAGRVITGDGPLPEALTAQLPDLAERATHGPVHFPLSATRNTADDIPDLIFAGRLGDSALYIVFDLSAALLGRSENVRTTNVDAAFAMVDTATLTLVTFGARNAEEHWSDPAVAALTRAVMADTEANQTQCTGNILTGRSCIAYHRLANSSVALAGLVGGDQLRRSWIRQSRPVWLFAACVMAGGLVSSILIGLWAHQRREDRRQLAIALEETRNAYAAKSNFMAHLSHEFFTPLNSIIGFSELMRKALFGPLGEPYAGYVDDIHTSAVHLQKIASDIMDAERIERGKLILSSGPANLNLTAADAKRMLAVFASRQGVTIDVVPWLRPATVEMDPHRALQIAVNLLSNAIKYSAPEGRVTISVEKIESGNFALTVADHGIGMTREEIAYTEQPFGHPADRRKGRHDSIGLGLPIVRGLLAAVGGKLVISSEKNKGTTVSAVFGTGNAPLS